MLMRTISGLTDGLFQQRYNTQALNGFNYLKLFFFSNFVWNSFTSRILKEARGVAVDLNKRLRAHLYMFPQEPDHLSEMGAKDKLTLKE